MEHALVGQIALINGSIQFRIDRQPFDPALGDSILVFAPPAPDTQDSEAGFLKSSDIK